MKDPGIQKVAKRYSDGVTFKNQVDLYDTVEENENFFIGKRLPM